MKNRILYGWNARRTLYAALGVAVIAYAIMAKEWYGAVIGGYFALMGIFNFGCASGNCSYQPRQRHKSTHDSASFEEIKTE